MADELGFADSRRVRHYREAGGRLVELDAPIASEPDSQSVLDVVADSNAAAPFDHLIKESDTALIQGALAELDKRESTILIMRYGLDDQTPRTLEEIGQALGVTRERIRQLQNLALEKLRAAVRKRDAPSPENGKSHDVAVWHRSCQAKMTDLL